MHKRVLLLTVLILIFLLAVSCGAQGEGGPDQPETFPVDAATGVTESTTQITTTTTTTTPSSEATSSETASVAAEHDYIPEGVRPIAVMIDNEGSKCLPQGGIDKAQIVYEMIVEGGVTRLMPVFWGTDPELIGPVRSSRHYFLDFCLEHDAIYTHIGWSPMAQADIPKLKIVNINGLYVGSDIIWDLTKDKSNWQDSYTSMEKLLEYSGRREYTVESNTGFPFSFSKTGEPPANGDTAEKLSIRYTSAYICSYEYDKDTGLYKRFRQGKPQMERVSGNQMDAKNIIVRFTKSYPIEGDREGRQEMITTGSGNGFFISGGKSIKIKWSKESRSARTKYLTEDGNELELSLGQTWIQVVPLAAKVTFE